MGWVILAMYKIMNEAVGWDKPTAIILFTGLAYSYTLLSGQWGVALTDLVQYVIMQGGAIVFAIYAVYNVGGLQALKDGVMKVTTNPQILDMTPNPGAGSIFSAEFWTPAFLGFATYSFVTWWANVNSDGGGKVIQKQNACKNEQHALLATLWYSLTNLAFRTWPWVLVPLASMIIYPTINDPEQAYPRLMMELLPSGLKGLLVASLIAAFMSTISTQLNWGASYLVTDFYKPLFAPKRDDRHYIRMSMVATTVVMVAAALAAYYTQSAADAFKFVIAFGAGTGPVYILRWFWWRVNAWSEISAMIASSAITVYLFSASGLHFGARLLVITFGSAAVWMTITLLTKPAPLDKLAEFFRRTKPYGAWGPVKEYARANGLIIPKPESSARALRGFAWGMALVFGMTLGLGYVLLLNTTLALVWLAVMVLGGFGLWKDGFLRTE